MGLTNLPNGVTAGDFAKLLADLAALTTKVNEHTTLLNELKTDLSAHTHGGVTTGTDTSAAGPTISSALTNTAITLQTT